MPRPFYVLILAAANNGTPELPTLSQPAVIVIIGVGSILGAGILVLTFVKLLQDVMGKRAATTLSIQAHSDNEPKEQPPKAAVIDVTGFVATKDFEAHKEEARLRAVGLEAQISQSRHDWARELQAVLSAATLRDEMTEEWRSEMSKDVKDSALKLAGVEKQSDLILTMMTNLDAKVDRNNERRRSSDS